MIQPPLREPYPPIQDLLPNQTLDLLYRPGDGPPVPTKFRMVGVVGTRHLFSPDDIQDLELVIPLLYHLSEFPDPDQRLSEVREERVDFAYGENSAPHGC